MNCDGGNGLWAKGAERKKSTMAKKISCLHFPTLPLSQTLYRLNTNKSPCFNPGEAANIASITSICLDEVQKLLCSIRVDVCIEILCVCLVVCVLCFDISLTSVDARVQGLVLLCLANLFSGSCLVTGSESGEKVFIDRVWNR